MSLESFKGRVADNVPGRYYVGYWCTDCDLCRAMAPTNFGRIGRRAGRGGYSYVMKQPVTPEEEAACREAMQYCCVQAIFGDGDQFDWSDHLPLSSPELMPQVQTTIPPAGEAGGGCGCKSKNRGPESQT